MSTTLVDLSFPLVGESLPLDHGYALYAAVSRQLGPGVHATNGIGLFPIRGLAAGNRQLHLDGERSRLRIRTPLERIPELLRLAGKQLELDGHRLRIGVPQTYALVPATMLGSRLVTIKGFRDPVPFLEAARRQLDELKIAGEAAIPLRTTGPHQGEPMRRVLRIKDKKVVGFAVIVSGLRADDSVQLQSIGIGGRRHMGAGLFLPAREEAE